MGQFTDKLASRFGYVRQTQITKTKRKRNFAAALSNNLTASFKAMSGSADQVITRDLQLMRDRSRSLVANNQYAKGFMLELRSNVVGSLGVGFQSKAMNSRNQSDDWANEKIETAWREYSKKGNFDVTGQLSRREFESLLVETVATCGEALVRKVPGYNNKFGFALQLIDPDHLDHTLNKDLKNGHRIRMGVELNKWSKPVAYYLLTVHPGDSYSSVSIKRFERVPASTLLHIRLPWRIGATRSIPWMHAAMIGLNDLGGYREAAIVAARVGATKMGFFTETGAEEYQGDAVTDDGELITEAEPAHFEKLPAGITLQSWDPEYPHANFDTFNKTVLRGICTSLGIQYFKLGNDLEGVNYTSSRTGLLSERDMWMGLQSWLIESFHEQFFSDWLASALLTELSILKSDRFKKYNAAVWQGRRWQWVDPAKEVKAQAEAINNNIKSVSETIRESGRDPDDVFNEIAKEREKFKQLNIQPNPDKSGFSNSEDLKNESEDTKTKK